MSFNRVGVTALVAAACIGVALACGPNFPWQLLDSREETVNAPVELNFAFEVSRLVSAPKDSLRAVESDRPVDDEAVTRQQPPRGQFSNEEEGRQVLPQVAPLARRNDDRSSSPDEIAAIQIARVLVEKAQVIRRVSRSMDHA